MTRWIFSGLTVGLICAGTSLEAAGRGTSAARFLLIDPGAESRAMSGAQVAVAKSLDALFWNPASLAGLQSRELASFYMRHSEGTNFGNVSLVWPAQKIGNVGGSISVLDSGSIPRTDDIGQPVGEFREISFVARAAWSYRLWDRFLVGAGPKLFRQTVDDFSLTGYAVDLGAVWMIDSNRTTVGLSVLNLGPQIQNRDLPTMVAAGVSYRPFNPLLLSGQVDYIKEGTLAGRIGAELKVYESVWLRAGYKIAPDELNLANFGFAYTISQSMTFNYAFGLNTSISPTNLISLNWKFGLKTEETND